MEIILGTASYNPKTEEVTLALPIESSIDNEAREDRPVHEVILPQLEEIEEEQEQPKRKYTTLRRLAIFEITFGITWIIMGSLAMWIHDQVGYDVRVHDIYIIPAMIFITGVITLLKGYLSLVQRYEQLSWKLTCENLSNHIFLLTIIASLAKFLTFFAAIMKFPGSSPGYTMKSAWIVSLILNLIFLILVAWSVLIEQRRMPNKIWEISLSSVTDFYNRIRNGQFLKFSRIQEYDDDDDLAIWDPEYTHVMSYPIDNNGLVPPKYDDINQLQKQQLIDFDQETVKEIPTNTIPADEKPPSYQDSLTVDQTNQENPPPCDAEN